jgi:outer membrane protein
MGVRVGPLVLLRSAAAILFLFGVVSCQISLAQSGAAPPAAAPAPGPTLTLKDAVRLALKQNPHVLVARLLSLESDRNRQVARSALLPQASLAADGALVQYNFQSIEKASSRVAAGPFQYIQAGPSFSQSLLDLPLIRDYQKSREGVRQTLAQESATREDVISSVVTQYLNVLRAFAFYEAAQSRVALAQRLYDQAVNLQSTGIGLNIDSTRAQVELQNEKQNLIDAETATHTSIYLLAELLDLPRDQEPLVTDKLQFFDLPEVDREQALTSALANRPEMKSQASQERIAHLERESAGEQRLPKIDFGGFWDYEGEHFDDGIPAYVYQLSFSVPLFTGGRIRAEVGEANLEEKRIQQNRQLLEAQIVREVKSALDELAAARKAVDVANLGLQLANDEVAQAQRRFAAGVTTNVEVVTAQDALARANNNQIDALYRFNESRVNLAQAMGEVEDTYAK